MTKRKKIMNDVPKQEPSLELRIALHRVLEGHEPEVMLAMRRVLGTSTRKLKAIKLTELNKTKES